MEVCPSCGDLVPEGEIQPNTGWCVKCTFGKAHERQCVRCSKVFSARGEDFICPSCKTNVWADAIEELIARSNGEVSLSRAKQLVAGENQAVCLCCGQYIPHATKGRHLFCTRYRQCRWAARRVKYFRYNKGYSKEDALEIILAEIKQARVVTPSV